ncbi:unnamed protein product [Eruca vesicaria subsp. sativa]|uniref:S12 n=1 Tax=Eruca vesicaria subsp. sativa TaxID=29727 RepID=A0ABC8LSL0_ERUVS|nr:unnamed protein product [Eruca vesicaria subsp. sativa]
MERKKLLLGPFHAKGITCQKIRIEAKQHNTVIDKCARVQLFRNGKKIIALARNMYFVFISGFGHKVYVVVDIPGVMYKVVKVSGVSISALYNGKEQPTS